MFSLFRENVRIALDSIKSQLLRTILTVVIIAIGIWALVGILSAVKVLENTISDNFASMGANTFNVQRYELQVQSQRGGERKKINPIISYNDVREFEDKVARHAGRQFGIAVCNGTAALDVAIAALDIGPGDEVIVPTFTIISCIHQIIRVGAHPVFIDCDAETWNLRVDDVEEKITRRTKAIMAVHIYGLPVDMNPLIKISL